MSTGRRLRVLSWHPHLGHPGDLVDDPGNGQAYVDVGLAEWADAKPPAESHTEAVETTQATPVVETATKRPSPRRRAPKP